VIADTSSPVAREVVHKDPLDRDTKGRREAHCEVRRSNREIAS
jgi:hypothetical protein